MTSMARRIGMVALGVVMVATKAGSAEADLAISATEVGGDVIIAGVGSLNRSGVTFVTVDPSSDQSSQQRSKIAKRRSRIRRAHVFGAA